MWCYNISPVKSEDVSSEFVSNTTSTNFTLSNENAVCWRVNSENITFSGVNASDNPKDSIFVDFIPFDADEVPTKEIHITVTQVAGTTLKGTYSIPVQISTDGGNTWTDEKSVTFSNVELSETEKQEENEQNKILSDSGGGCEIGLGAFVLSILFLKRKTR